MQSSFSRFSLQMNETNEKKEKKNTFLKEIKSNQFIRFMCWRWTLQAKGNCLHMHKIKGYFSAQAVEFSTIFFFSILSLIRLLRIHFIIVVVIVCRSLWSLFVVFFFFSSTQLYIYICIFFFLFFLKLKLMNHTVNQNPVCHVRLQMDFDRNNIATNWSIGVSIEFII